MKIIQGDLLKLANQGHFDVIIHGCNCFCIMGKGLALSIKHELPEAYEADLRTSLGDTRKLGTFSSAEIRRDPVTFTVVNAYIQYDWRGLGVKANYEAIRSVFRKIGHDFSGLRIGYPKIGAGLAGGDWAVIAEIIEQELRGEDHTLVEFVPAK